MANRIEVVVAGNASSLVRALGQSSGALGRFDSTLGRLATRGLLAGGAAIAGLGALSAKAAIDFESSFAGIRKTVEATEPQFEELERGIRNMAKEIPTGVNALNAIGESAGQLGIQRKALLGFIRTVADLGETTNLVGEEASSSLAKIANVTGMKQTNENFRRLGSTIVALGNQGASTEADIVAMGLRIAGTGHLVGLSVPQILGLANALSSMGIEAEAGGTAVSTTFSKMQSAVGTGGAVLEKWAKAAGVSSAEFARTFKDDAAGALDLFLGGLKRVIASGGDVQGFLMDLGLGGIRVSDTLKKMASNQDLVTASIKTGNQAWAENSALGEEAEKRYKTTASQLKILGNRWMDLKIVIGEQLLPVINDVIKRIVKFADRLGAAVTIRAKLNVIWEGIESVGSDLWDKIETAILGDKRTIFVPALDRVTVTGGEGLAAKISAELQKVDWANIFTEAFKAAGGAEDKAAETVLGPYINAFKDPGRWKQAFTGLGSLVGRGLLDELTSALGMARALGTTAGNITDFLGREMVAGIRRGLDPIVFAVASRLSGVLSAIRAAVGPSVTAAAALADRIVSGVRSGLSGLAAAALSRLNQIISAIAQTASNAFSAAVAIGSSIISGVISGLAGLVSRVASAIAGGIRRAIDIAKSSVGSTAEQYAQSQLGEPMGRGVIRGWIISSASLPEKMKEGVRKAIEAARVEVDKARDIFENAFDRLTSKVLRAFDAITAAHRTPAEAELEAIERRREQERLTDAVTSATSDLARAQQEAAKNTDPERAADLAAAVVSAEKRLALAKEDLVVAQLRVQAERERIEYEAKRDRSRESLELRLDKLAAQIEKGGKPARAALKKLVGLLAAFNIDMEIVGEQLGLAFVAGLNKTLIEAAKAANAIANTVRDALGLAPLPVPGNLGAGLATGVPRPTVAATGGGTTIVNNFPNYIGSKQELISTIQSGLLQQKLRGGF